MLEKLAAALPSSLVVSAWKMLPDSLGIKRFLTWNANAKFIGGVWGLVYAENGDLLILKHTYKPTPWALPGGALRREQPGAGLKREIFEETGFSVKPLRVLDVIYTGKPPQLIVVIKARLLGGLFVPSAEVSGYTFIKGDDGLDKLPAPQRRIVERYRAV